MLLAQRFDTRRKEALTSVDRRPPKCVAPMNSAKHGHNRKRMVSDQAPAAIVNLSLVNRTRADLLPA